MGGDRLYYQRREAYHVALSEPGLFTERLELFIAPYTPQDKQGEGGGLKHEGEDIEVMEIPLTEALSMIADGKIQDAKTIILLQYAALNGLVGK